MSIWDWSKTAASNTVLESVSWAEGMSPAAVNNGARALAAALKKWQEALGGAITRSGTDTITVTTNGVITALAEGQMLAFTAGGTKTGAATFNPDSVGAQDIKKFTTVGLTALAANDII